MYSNNSPFEICITFRQNFARRREFDEFNHLSSCTIVREKGKIFPLIDARNFQIISRITDKNETQTGNLIIFAVIIINVKKRKFPILEFFDEFYIKKKIL